MWGSLKGHELNLDIDGVLFQPLIKPFLFYFFTAWKTFVVDEGNFKVSLNIGMHDDTGISVLSDKGFKFIYLYLPVMNISTDKPIG